MSQRMRMAAVVPQGYQRVAQLQQYCEQNVPKTVLELVKLRASVINGCAFCVNMHSHDAIKEGEDPQRLFQVSAWHDAACFTPAERAALALTDEVTRIGDGGVSDEVWAQAREHWSEEEVANLILAIAAINVWNRIAISTRAVPTSYAS
jgi:AhpD family alkylhydroperoxidase